MSRPATWSNTGILGALDRASTLARETTVRQAWYDLGWQWLCILAGLVVLDLVVELPVWGRWLGVGALAVFAVAKAIWIRQTISRKQYSNEHAARMVEEAQPGMDNVLINAVQFQRIVGGTPDTQAELMRVEIARAETVVANTPMENVISRQAERRALTFFFSAVGAWALGSLVIPGVLFAILPRLFAPWLDNITPPYSLTKIEIDPKGALVKYGGALIVTATVRGPIPDDLRLATQTGKGGWTTTPLESTEPGKYAITLSDLHADTWIVARGGGARSGRYLVKVVLPPVSESLEAHYIYPKYTGFKDATEHVGEAGVHGLRNTSVSLKVSANRALKGGTLVVELEGTAAMSYPLQLDPKDPTKAVASFPIIAAGKFRVDLLSSDSQENADAAHGKVVLEHDERPSVWFNQPAPEVVVTPNMKVNLEIEAQDDIGVQRIDLHRIINGIADNNQTLFQGPPAKHTGTALTLDMADLGVRPGDELTYYANAYDNDPGHPNFAETEAYKIKVMSAEDYKKLLKDQRDAETLKNEVSNIKEAIGSLAERQQELAEKMDRAEKALKKNPNDADAKQAMAAAQSEQKKLADEAGKLAKQLQQYAESPSASEIEKAIKEKVAEAAKAIAAAANGPMKSAQGGMPSPASEAKKAADDLKKTAEKADKSVGAAIRNLEKALPLFADVEKFKELTNRQGQLVLQSREFQDNTPNDDASRSKMDAIASEQRTVQDELKQLQEDFRRHAADAKKDFPKASASALRIADEIGARKIPNLMGNAFDGFSQELGPEGFAAAQKALEQMESMIQKGGACQGACKGELDVSLNESLGKSGLGQSLGDGSGMGVGQGNGLGFGAGSSGSPSNSAGSMGGTSASHSLRAYTMSMKNLSSESGSKFAHSQNRKQAPDTSLSANQVEDLANGQHKPPKASDDAASQYPPEYRKLVKDYFISVTKEKKH